MSLEGAINVVTQICRSAQLTADDHDAVFSALDILVAAAQEPNGKESNG